MVDFNSSFGQSSAEWGYGGDVPPAPTPPATPPGALSAAAPALGLNLKTVTIIVSGDINITTTFTNAVIQRR